MAGIDSQGIIFPCSLRSYSTKVPEIRDFFFSVERRSGQGQFRMLGSREASLALSVFVAIDRGLSV
ncbi:MAG: hypothetical protein LBI13_01675 [Streptococcaceae bacterium]|nr:hypothetical protein [Streptococcaceae bacterium]